MWNPHASSADFCRREMLQKRAREERSRRRKAARNAAKNARADWSIRAADCKDRSCRALHERESPINVGAITENVSLRGARPDYGFSLRSGCARASGCSEGASEFASAGGLLCGKRKICCWPPTGVCVVGWQKTPTPYCCQGMLLIKRRLGFLRWSGSNRISGIATSGRPFSPD